MLKEFNQGLRTQLLNMQSENLNVLEELITNGELKTDDYHPKIEAIHLKNTADIRAIIEQHGWPGMSLVGKDGAQAAWMLVLHAVQDLNFMSKCLNLMRRAVLQGEAERWCLAYLEDRVLLLTGKQQKYGTQFLVNAEGKTYPLNLREP